MATRLHEVIQMMPIGLYIKDPDGLVTLMNSACQVQFGLSVGPSSRAPTRPSSRAA
ncbi:PAS domain-containing protein [Massilia sp. H-1]|nr:PAS domain-containing protein [Massilia sp. H-1]